MVRRLLTAAALMWGAQANAETLVLEPDWKLIDFVYAVQDGPGPKHNAYEFALQSFEIRSTLDGIARVRYGNIQTVKAGEDITVVLPGAGLTAFGYLWAPIEVFWAPGLRAPFYIRNVVYERTLVGHLPEPAAWAAMLLGFCMAGSAVRRRRRLLWA